MTDSSLRTQVWQSVVSATQLTFVYLASWTLYNFVVILFKTSIPHAYQQKYIVWYGLCAVIIMFSLLILVTLVCTSLTATAATAAGSTSSTST